MDTIRVLALGVASIVIDCIIIVARTMKRAVIKLR